MSTALETTLTVRTLRALDELASIREAWRALQFHPWSDFDYFTQYIAHQEGFVRPHVLVLERAGRPIALVVGSLRRERVPWRIGSLTIWNSRALILRVGGGGIMGESSAEVARAITAELQAALARGEAAAVYLHQVDSAAELLRSVQGVGGLLRDRWARPVGGWVLDLPETYAAYHASRTKSVRRHMRRYANVLERELGSDVTVVCHRDPADLERLIQDSEAVARLTYHRRMGVGFDGAGSARQVFAHAAQAGWLRGYVMYARGKPIAFWHGLVYGRTFYTRDTGYDPAFGELRPGNYLLNKVIEEHCRTHESERFDYGIMDLEYKRNFGSRRYERSSIYLFSRRPGGLWLSMLRTLSGSADRVARALLGERARRWARKLGALGRPSSGAPARSEDGEARAPAASGAAGKDDAAD